MRCVYAIPFLVTHRLPRENAPGFSRGEDSTRPGHLPAMAQNLTPAQQTQLENRDSTGQWKTKSHGDVDDTADVLGVSEPQGEPMPVDAYPSDENAARVAETIDELGITGTSESLGHCRMDIGEYRESYAVTLRDREGYQMQMPYMASVNDRDAVPSVNRVLGSVVEDSHVYDETAEAPGDHFANWCQHYGIDLAEAEDDGEKENFEAIGEQRDQLVGFLGEDGYEHARFGEVLTNGRENRDYDEQSDEQRAVDLDESVEAIHDIDPTHDIDGRDYEDALDRVQGLAAEAISAGQASDVESSYELAQSRSGDFRAMDMDDHADREDDVAERIKIELDDATAKS